jgi:dipeptidyl aminopeptidase/acylaminoacyl peptidase
MTVAQQIVPLAAEDVLQISSPRPPIEFSPDGKWLAYGAQTRASTKPMNDEDPLRTGVPWWGIGSDIFIVNIKTHETRNLTGSTANNWLPAWSPDGRYLAFLSDRGGTGQARLWVWNTEKNELNNGSDLPVRMQGLDRIQWTPDGLKVLLASVPVDMSLADYARETYQSDDAGQEVGTAESSGSTVTLYRSDTSVAIRGGQPRAERLSLVNELRDLSLVEVSTGSVQTITHHQRIGAFHLLPNGTSVAYSTPQWFEDTGSQRAIYNLAVLTLSSYQEKVIATGIDLNFAGEFSFSVDGSQLTYGAGGQKGVLDIYAVAVGGGKPRNLTRFQQESEKPRSLIPLWDARGKNVYFIKGGTLWRSSVRDGSAEEVARVAGRDIELLLRQTNNLLWTDIDARSTVVVTRDYTSKLEGFYKIDLSSGITTRLLENGECYTCAGGEGGQFGAISRDGEAFAFFTEDAQHAMEIWKADPAFAQAERLTYLNAQLDKVKMGNVRVIDWLSDDGDRLYGALLLPSAFEQGRRYPLIVLVYPSAFLSNNFNHFGGTSFVNMQLFATRGYAVLLADSPQHVGTPITDVARTVLPGVNKVVEMGIADPDRLGLMGHSNGGYGTLSLIVATKRFKAAIEASGTADLIGFYGEMSRDGFALGNALERSIDPLGGTPWDDRDRYIENSPIFYLDRVETPLLIVHGAEDTTVDSFLGDELFVGLRRLGKVVEYAKYGGEGHELTSRANVLDFTNRAISWFNKFLQQGSSEGAALSDKSKGLQ